MKIRLKENEIRVRIDRAEVEQLLETGFIKLMIPAGLISPLAFILCLKDSSKANITIENLQWLIDMPKKEAQKWATDYSHVHTQTLPGSDGMNTQIIFEIDFSKHKHASA